MTTFRNIILATAKIATSFDDFADKIYNLNGITAIISDLDDGIVEYLDNNYKWHSVNVHKYVDKF